MKLEELKDFLDEKTAQYQTHGFIADDPVSIPHRFSRKEDIEIAGVLASTIAWGNRKAILKSCDIMMDMLDNSPYEYVTQATDADLKMLESFVYRTFQADDLPGMVRGLRSIYADGGLECLMTPREGESVREGIARFRSAMLPHLSQRTYKHVADVAGGAAGKRLNMFLRWMVRSNDGQVDFGLWKGIRPSQLMLPLDVHTGNTSRALGILQRKQNDWKAVEEVTATLRMMCPDDPVKYDFALFGLGIYEHWKNVE
ncbi:MAG: TIGR02757 family protein [Bacteroidales bacterium]|nr:TIGR02757 family protein [Bacteroidales bacterium]